MLTKGFQKGSGCFNCKGCGRKTRDTGIQSMGCPLCPDCYELAGDFNSYQDGDITLETFTQIFNATKIAVTIKGGSLDLVKYLA